MHELSIARHLLDLVREHVPACDHERIRDVRLRVGPLAGVVVDSLEFCFGVLVAEEGPRAARLVVERTGARTRCAACGHEREMERPPDGTWAAWIPPEPACGACGAGRVELLGGQELELVSVELAGAPASRGPRDGEPTRS